MKIQRRALGERVYAVRLDGTGRAEVAADSVESLLAGEVVEDEVLLGRLNSAPARVLPPTMPSKIVCVGLNYRRHAVEMNKKIPDEPLIFMKPSTSVVGPGQAIVVPPQSDLVHHEAELAVVIGARATRVTVDKAAAFIRGYTLMNDVTARDIQRREGKYTRAKGFDTFAPLGPTLVTDLDPDRVRLELSVNGTVRQAETCDDLIFKIPELIAFISSVMTLLPGDVISTGTPDGVGPLVPGDVVRLSAESIGALENPVVGPDDNR